MRINNTTGADELKRPVLDDIDRVLALALQNDGRASYTKLAALVGMSQAGVRTRLQRLLSSGALQIAAIADPFAFGFSVTAMLGISYSGDLRQLTEHLDGLEMVHFVVITAGRYDCLAEVLCVDTSDLLALVNEQIRTAPGVTDVDIMMYLKLHKQWQPEYLRRRPGDPELEAPSSVAG